MQCKLLPIALCKSTAATDESTPPDNPRITLSSPTCAFNCLQVSSTNESGVQSPEHPQISTTKFFIKSFPSDEW